MHTTLGLALVLLSQSVAADSLIRIENSPNNKCAESGCDYYEWSLTSAPQIRLVISGYEDGSSRDFYRLESDGSYTHLLEIHPMVKDADGTYWWGYPQDITGLPHRWENNQLRIWATFQHTQCDDGNHTHPPWQLRVPVVLFEGAKKAWNVAQPDYTYRDMSLDELISESAVAGEPSSSCS